MVTVVPQETDHAVGEEDPAGQGDQSCGGLRGWTGRDAGHEGWNTSHVCAIHPAHEAAGTHDTGDGESCLQVQP